MSKYKLPVDYDKLTWQEKREVREQYIKEQSRMCFYCKEDLKHPAPKRIVRKYIDWKLFPKGFLNHPIHLQHDHNTGMTEGAVHSNCNAYMWYYEGR